MNYRALEDLVGILVKKAGYKLSDLRVEEDIDFMEERKVALEGEISSLKTKLDTYKYIDKDEKTKDEEEKRYLEETLNTLTNSLADLDSKLNDKSIKTGVRRKLYGEKTLLENEITDVEELLELANLKLENKLYFDQNTKSKDEVNLAVLESELEEVEKSLEEKYINPVVIGNKLLDAFKEGKPFGAVSDIFEILTTKARNEYDRTTKEVKDSNIFELMDRYTTMKRDVATNLENNGYANEDIRQSLFEKERYHNSRIDTFKNTLDGIDKRKAELSTLIDESKKLYDSIHKEREQKEDKLNFLVDVLYNESNLVLEEEDYKRAIADLRVEIADDKYLENKYDSDIQSFKDEIKNLDINYTNINNEISVEERSLDIIHEKLNNNAVDLLAKFEDKVNFLVYSNRVDSLVNEQQYLYVNVDVIKDEVISLWNKGDDDSTPNKKPTNKFTKVDTRREPVRPVENKKTEEEKEEELLTSIYNKSMEMPREEKTTEPEKTPEPVITPPTSPEVNTPPEVKPETEQVEVIDYLE